MIAGAWEFQEEEWKGRKFFSLRERTDSFAWFVRPAKIMKSSGLVFFSQSSFHGLDSDLSNIIPVFASAVLIGSETFNIHLLSRGSSNLLDLGNLEAHDPRRAGQ